MLLFPDGLDTLLKEHSELLDEDATLDEVLSGVICLNYIAKVNGRPEPTDYPLRSVWISQQLRVPNLNTIFRSENRVRD